MAENQWTEKYRRESWTFPLGSLLNAYASTIQGKDKSSKEIIEATELFYLKSREMVNRSIDEIEDTKPKSAVIPF